MPWGEEGGMRMRDSNQSNKAGGLKALEAGPCGRAKGSRPPKGPKPRDICHRVRS